MSLKSEGWIALLHLATCCKRNLDIVISDNAKKGFLDKNRHPTPFTLVLWFMFKRFRMPCGRSSRIRFWTARISDERPDASELRLEERYHWLSQSRLHQSSSQNYWWSSERSIHFKFKQICWAYQMRETLLVLLSIEAMLACCMRHNATQHALRRSVILSLLLVSEIHDLHPSKWLITG